MTRLRVALFGSPAFAVPVLRMLNKEHDVKLVVTQPDKKAGRGLKLTPPATAQEAKHLNLPLAQPGRLKNNTDFHERLQQLELDVAVTAAYGKLLPESLLSVPAHGFLNVHGSLLPKYRGAAPIQWALINGETETGVSIMQTEAGLDTGPVRHVRKLLIKPEDNALSLFNALSELGVSALQEALELLSEGALPSVPQNDALATIAPLLTKEDGQIRWSDSADAIMNRFRGVIAWPGSWTLRNEKTLKVHDLQVLDASNDAEAGTVVNVASDGVDVMTADKLVRLRTVQAAGKARMQAFDWANGYHVKVGERLG